MWMRRTGELESDDRIARFERLVRANERVVWELAYRMLGSQTVAEDVIQDALVRAFRGLPRLRSADEAVQRAWLCRIVHHRCVDAIRDQSRRVRLQAEAERLAALERGSSNPEPEIASTLRSLPLEMRAPLVLVYVLGFDYATSAEVLGIAPGTLSSRLARGKQLLRRRLGEASEIRGVR